MTDQEDEIGRFIIAGLRQQSAVMEEWCERSITDPESRGVMMIQDPATLTTRICLSYLVPYGHVYEFPTEGSVDRWIERGCPTE